MKIYPKFKKVLSFILTFSILLSIIPTFSLTVSANTVNVLDGKISISDSANSISQSNGIVTITAKGSLFSKKTNDITIINNSGKNSILSFDYSATKYSSFTINETGVQSASGTHKQQLAPGGTVVIKIISNSGLSNTTATLTISKFGLVENKDSNVTVEFKANEGTVNIGGSPIESGHTILVPSDSEGLVVNALPKSGFQFFGWKDSSGEYLSYDANTTLSFVDSTTITAEFIPTSKAIFGVGAQRFYDLNEACTVANAGSIKNVVLLNNGTLDSGNYTIPSGVTLLIPFDSAHKSYGSDPETVKIEATPATPVAFRTLYISNETVINVNGNIEVAAKHYACHGGKDFSSRPVKEYGYIVMEGNSKIILNSGAKLYAWGYISGSNQAEVIAESGATIYEKMQVTDYRGGTATSAVTKDGHFPFSQYYIQNVEVKETIKYGAQLICQAAIYAFFINENTVDFMGSDSMFTLESGSYATKYYDVETDRLIVDVYGNFKFNPISIMGENTKEFVLPLQQNMTINIKSGTSTINQDIMLQPGCYINVEKDATLKLASGIKAYLMDSDDWGTFCSATPRKLVPLTYVPTLKGAPNKRTADNMQDAKININGTLIVDGAIFATNGRASIVSTEKTGKIQFNSATIESDSIKQCTTNAESGFVDISMYPVYLTNGNTKFSVTDTSGTTAETTYYYNTDCDMWVTHGANGHGYTWKANENEHWQECVCGNKINFGTHADENLDHNCDNGCDVVFGEHKDDGKDHVCDYGCNETIGACEDTNKDHLCDYGCDKVHGTCEDKDFDHACDYGCDKVYGTCEDKDFDHACDYGCDKVYGTCEDKDHDHKCDYGCDKVHGTCEDADFDHDCDYGCDKTYGEHGDSDDDKDHLCDYCKEKVEECHGGKATCTEDAVCVECGEVYEKALGHSFDNELDVSCNRDGCDFTREAYIGDVSYATFEDALAAAKEGDTIVVLSKIVIEGERTLDLTGITIDSKYVDFDNYAMVVKGNLTINGGSFNFDNYYGIGVTGKLTVNGGKFTTTKDYYLIGNFGETVINGGEFEALYCNVNSFAGTVNITGGKFTVSDYSNPDYPPCDVFAEDGGEAIITGGDFSTDVTNYCPNGHTVENNDNRFIYGEHVYNTVVTAPTCTEKGFTTHTCTVCGDSYSDNETAATGHSFDDDFDADCNNGCGHVRDAKTLVAMIGEVKFDSLTEAVLTAKDGETIVLCKDVALTEKLVVATTQKWDFGSYTVTLANGDENYSLVVKGDLTIESGTFVVSGWYGIGVTGKLTVNGGTIEYSEYNDYLIGNWGETVINGGTFNGQYCCVNNFAGNTVINGGDFTTELKDATGEYDSCDLMADSGLIVNGGTFSKDVTIYCDNDYHTCDVDGDGRFVYEEHSYDSVVTEPTCTEKGYTTYTCHCGDSYVGDNVDATGHDYAETVTDPTCTKKGYTTHTCTICGDSYTDNETDATGHDYAETVTDPTCTEDGYTTHTCTVCGDSYTDNKTDATGHSYDDDFDATCNNGCGHVREAKILVAMIGNTKFDSLSEAVNTAKDGETIVLFKDVVLTEKLNVESTQKWDFGNYTVTLADVNDNYSLVVTGDLTIESGNFVAPGLYGIGVTGKLTVNGGMFKTTKDYYLIGNFGETVINGGEFEALYCNVNSFAGTVNITGGKFTVSDYSNPDYPPCDVFAEDGGEAIITGGNFSTDVTNYCPDGHTVENNDGRFIYGEHVYTTVVTKPTCTEKGHTTYTCECGDTYVDSYVDANGHKYDAVVTDPTCTEGGYTTHTCTVCGDTYVDSYVDENGHDYDDVVTKPTCTKGGYTTHTCTVCGDTYVDSYVDESGHTHGGYEYDLYKHWSICSVDGCGVRFCEEDHVFIDDACKCGAKRVSVDKVGNTEINYTVIGQTVTVTHEDACTVVYISDGEYVKLDAVVNGDGSYSFTAPENVTEVQLFVIGDYDGNGALTEDDATSLRNALLGKETLNDTPEFIYDVSGDGKVTALDLALISAAAQRSIKLG